MRKMMIAVYILEKAPSRMLVGACLLVVPSNRGIKWYGATFLADGVNLQNIIDLLTFCLF